MSPTEIFSGADADGDDNLTYDEFMKYAVETFAPEGKTVESLSEEEAEGLKKAFGELDLNGDGTATLEEFNKKMAEYYAIDEAAAEEYGSDSDDESCDDDSCDDE